MAIMETLYYILNKPYFLVYVLSNGRRIKKFVQLAATSENSDQSFFLIDKNLKCAWIKPEQPIIDGIKFITFVNLNNAIPLKIEETTEYDTHEYYTKETVYQKIEVDKSKPKKSGAPMKVVEICLPPTVLYQTIDAAFIPKLLSAPLGKYAELKIVFIVLIIGLVFLAWTFINKGVSPLG